MDAKLRILSGTCCVVGDRQRYILRHEVEKQERLSRSRESLSGVMMLWVLEMECDDERGRLFGFALGVRAFGWGEGGGVRRKIEGFWKAGFRIEAVLHVLERVCRQPRKNRCMLCSIVPALLHIVFVFL